MRSLAARACCSAILSLVTYTSNAGETLRKKHCQRACSRPLAVQLVRTPTRSEAGETPVPYYRMRIGKAIRHLAFSIAPCRSFARTARHLTRIRVVGGERRLDVRTEVSDVPCIPLLPQPVGSDKQPSAAHKRSDHLLMLTVV